MNEQTVKRDRWSDAKEIVLVLEGIRARIGNRLFFMLYQLTGKFKNINTARNSFNTAKRNQQFPEKNNIIEVFCLDFKNQDPLDDTYNFNNSITKICANILKKYSEYFVLGNPAESFYNSINMSRDRELCKKVFSSYSGIYEAKYSWVTPSVEGNDFVTEGGYEPALYTIFINIYEYNEEDGFIKVKMTTSAEYNSYKGKMKDKQNIVYTWGWNGILIPLKINYFYLILKNKNKKAPIIISICSSEMVGKSQPMEGIFTAHPTKAFKCQSPPILSSTRIYLKHIEDCDTELLEKDYDRLSIQHMNENNNELIKYKNKLDQFDLLSIE